MTKNVIFRWTALLSGGADDRCVVCVCGCVKREKVCGRTCSGIVLWVSLRQELELWSSLSLSPDWWDETACLASNTLAPFYSLSHSHTFFLVLFFQSVRRNSICSPFLTFSNSVSFFLSLILTLISICFMSVSGSASKPSKLST